MIARCLVTGPSMQGVLFRETVARVADKKELKGSARNLVDGVVELLFAFDKEKDKEGIKQCIVIALEKTAEEGLIDTWDIVDVRINGAGIDSFDLGEPITDIDIENQLKSKKRFVVEREHELKETVWALQGAGKVFLSASKKVEELLGYKEREVIGRLLSVQKELLYIQYHPRTAREPVCLKQFIIDPLVYLDSKPGEPDIIRDLIEFYHDYMTCLGDKQGMSNVEFVNRIDKLNEGIKKLIETINNAKRQKDN